jgi:hypothetical protein
MSASIDVGTEGVLSRLTDLDFDEKIELSESNQFSHYADAAKVTESYVVGTPIEALCGKIFIPSRDPKRFPICPICQELVNALLLYTEE